MSGLPEEQFPIECGEEDRLREVWIMRIATCLLLVLVLAGALCVTSFATTFDFNGGVVNGNGVLNGNGTTNGSVNPLLGLHQLYQFAAKNAINGALFFQGEAQSLRAQAVAKGFDVSAIDDLLAKADALLAEAQACFEEGDFRCAGRKALDAVYLYQQAISDLGALLNG
jgi:hypothetical protein